MFTTTRATSARGAATSPASIWIRWKSDEDVALVRGLLERHRDYTGSPRAAWILENWAEAQARFIKVFPHEYKRVLGVARPEKDESNTASPLVGASVAGASEVKHG